MTLLLVPILLPILGGVATGLIRFSSGGGRSATSVECIALANSALLFYLVFRGQGLSLSALRLTENLTITLRVDGLTRVFGALIAFLLPWRRSTPSNTWRPKGARTHSSPTI